MSKSLNPQDTKLIFITLDGVRWDEFFAGSQFSPETKSKLKRFWSKHSKRFDIYGGDKKNSPFLASHPSLISLPCYQTIFTGESVDGNDNSLDLVEEHTWLDKTVRSLGLAKEQAAVFASWETIKLAVSNEPDKIMINAGFDKGTQTPEIKTISRIQQDDLPPWKDCRWDKYTLGMAESYVRKIKPRVTYISLTDSDDAAHTGVFSDYIEAIERFDVWLDGFIEYLETDDYYSQNTHVVITTDHGRGLDEEWVDHNSDIPYAKFIWLAHRHLGTDQKASLMGISEHTDLAQTMFSIMAH
jgi:hypothetical protein